MQRDDRGLAITTDSAEAANAFNAAARSYLDWRTDTMDHLNQALEADPEFILANALKGLLMFGLRQPGAHPAAGRHLEAARQAATPPTAREELYVKALELSLQGDIAGAVNCYEQIVVVDPTDLLALRLCQFELFWLGEAKWIRDICETAAPAWSEDIPGYSAYLAVRAFSLEESGEYEKAEQAGRRAIELDPGDCWAAHAVAHVLEMEGRLEEGIDWLDALKGEWAGANHIVHHLWWHRCLFASERGDHDQALQVYDQYVRNPDSPLVKAVPDFYLDIQNCAALLLRLELRGIDVGERWDAVADIAEPRIGNHESPFTSPHCAIILAAAGRFEKARELLVQMRSFAGTDPGTLGPRYAVAAIPAAEAAIAHRQGEYEKVLQLLMPARRNLWQMGGSHAQRDLFFQIAADAAARQGRRSELAIITSDVRSIGFSGLEARTSYADTVGMAAG